MNHLDTLQNLIKQGMTTLEAWREFEATDLREALREELAREGIGGPLFRLACQALREEMDEDSMAQAIDLWMAGWTSESHGTSQAAVMSWYWRAPSKRPGKPGRKYLSTNQAWRALQKHLAESQGPV